LLYLVVFGASLPLTAEPPEGGTINDAIRKEDVAAVKRFIQGGADLNPNPEVTDSPLATAVRQGNVEIIRLLLDNGANPNSYLNEGPFTATPILFLVLDREDKALMDLFMERGVSRDDFNGYLLASLSSGQHLNMARLILDRGLARIDSSLPFLLRYAVGTPETRALIASHSREITEGKANLLDEMLRNKGLSIVYGRHDPDLKLPLATAILGDKGDPFRYSAEKAVDGNVETSWVEGVKSDGIG